MAEFGLNNALPYWVNMHLPAEMETAEKVPTARPEIVESYRDFQPPFRFKETVDDLLDAGPPGNGDFTNRRLRFHDNDDSTRNK